MRLSVTAQHGVPGDIFSGFGRLLRNRPKNLSGQGNDDYEKFN